MPCKVCGVFFRGHPRFNKRNPGVFSAYVLTVPGLEIFCLEDFLWKLIRKNLSVLKEAGDNTRVPFL